LYQWQPGQSLKLISNSIQMIHKINEEEFAFFHFNDKKEWTLSKLSILFSSYAISPLFVETTSASIKAKGYAFDATSMMLLLLYKN
jgi:hypothetical protein